MHTHDYLMLALYAVLLFGAGYPLGLYIARLLASDGLKTHWLTAPERGLYRLAGIERNSDMSWQRYAISVIVFNALGALVVYALQRLQAVRSPFDALPLQPIDGSQENGRQR